MSRASAIEAVARALAPGAFDHAWVSVDQGRAQAAARKDAAELVDAAAPHLAPEALREAATAWQLGGWAEKLPERSSRVELIIGVAQRATDFLRARADRLEQDHP